MRKQLGYTPVWHEGFNRRYSMPHIGPQKAKLLQPRRRPRQRTVKLFGLLLIFAMPACKKRMPKAVHVPEMAQGFDASPIDATKLTESALSRHHVLNMGLPELSHRLGSFALRTQTTITLSQESRTLSQKVHTGVYVRDEAGNTHLQTGNADHQLELIAKDDKAYVRQDRGHLRQKRRQEVDEVEMGEASVANVRELLQHFPGATLAHGTPATWEGREATRYDATLGDIKQEDLVPQPSLALLPVAAPSRWREEARHPRLAGKVVVDGATGAVVKADLTGSISITGATGQPVTLTLRAVHTLTDIGTVSGVREPPQSIGEIRRPMRPRDPLSFFREAQKGRPEAAGKPAAAKALAAPNPADDADGRGPPDEDLPDPE